MMMMMKDVPLVENAKFHSSCNNPRANNITLVIHITEIVATNYFN